jgi:hypothetical protein
MRSRSLRNLFGGIVAGVVPAAAWSGCATETACDPTEVVRRNAYDITVASDGTVLETSAQAPDGGDSGVQGPILRDGGVDAGERDSGTPLDCMSVCPRLNPCAGEATVGCSWIARSGDHFVARCESEVYRACPTSVICGRRPARLYLGPTMRRGAPSALGALLSQMAALELASVPAFRNLARELKAHGAPEQLCRAAQRAASDEVRHHRVMGALARNHGASPPPVRVSQSKVRSLARIAEENTVEGCVREAFGALVATWQAKTARDPEVRRAMRAIARDEVRHAALAFRVGAWIEKRLDAAQRARIDRAQRRAIEALYQDLGVEPTREWVVDAGLPTSAEARQLFGGLARSIWGHRPDVRRPRRGHDGAAVATNKRAGTAPAETC